MRRQRLMLLAVACASAGSACASRQPSPFFGDERYLVLGVDPDAEADRVTADLEKSGYRVTRKLRGQNFSALGADDDAGPASVRVITLRGIALALDAVLGDALQPGVRYALLPPPSSETHDADGDGFEEVFVDVRAEKEPACIRVYRVRDSGFVDLVTSGFALAPQPNAAPPWNAPQLCEDAPQPTPAPTAPAPPAAASPPAR